MADDLDTVSRPSTSDHIEKIQLSSKWCTVLSQREKGIPESPHMVLCCSPAPATTGYLFPKTQHFPSADLISAHVFPLLWNLQIVKRNRSNFLIFHLDYGSLNWTENLASLSFFSNLLTSAGMKSTRTKGSRTGWARFGHSGWFQLWYFWKPDFGKARLGC